ncbi:MAG: hypothetical protein JWR74_2675 [Polaromonas sp.]|nr:hypothetical protein [Polaromonas sp.]
MLIEVLVAMLLLAIGMLSLGATMAVAVQMPKLSSFHAAAVNLAASHIDRIRANPGGFDSYKKPLNESGWSFAPIESNDCVYPECTESSLAAMDDAATRKAVRIALPAGDLLVTCDSATCTRNSHGNLWIVWQEPSTYAVLDPSSSDNCPAQVTQVYTLPKPRCLYMGFKV